VRFRDSPRSKVFGDENGEQTPPLYLSKNQQAHHIGRHQDD